MWELENRGEKEKRNERKKRHGKVQQKEGKKSDSHTEIPITLTSIIQLSRPARIIRLYHEAYTLLNTRPPRGHGPPQLALLLALLDAAQLAVVPQLGQELLAKLVPDIVNLVKLSKVQRAVGVDRGTHVAASFRVLRALEGVDAADVSEAGLDLGERGRVGKGAEGVPAVQESPEAGEGIAELLRGVVIEGADIDGEDGVGAQGLHVGDGEVVDVAAVDEHVPLIAQRRDEAGEGHGRADVAPDVARGVDLGAGARDVGRVAVVLEPEVLDLGVAKRLEDSAVELVASGVGGAEPLATVKKEERATYDG